MSLASIDVSAVIEPISLACPKGGINEVVARDLLRCYLIAFVGRVLGHIYKVFFTVMAPKNSKSSKTFPDVIHSGHSLLLFRD